MKPALTALCILLVALQASTTPIDGPLAATTLASRDVDTSPRLTGMDVAPYTSRIETRGKHCFWIFCFCFSSCD